MKKIIYLLLVLIVVSCAHTKKRLPPKIDLGVTPGGNSNNWFYVTNTSSHTIIEINNKSINQINNLVYFEERFTFINPENSVKFTINKAVIDCNKKKYASINTITYDKLGRKIKAFDLTPTLMPISLGSVSMTKYQYLCTKKFARL
jgi:hypothetical protein